MNKNDALKLKAGTKIEVLPRVEYQHLSRGAVIHPPKKIIKNGYKTVVRCVEEDLGKVYIETGRGDFVPAESVKLID